MKRILALLLCLLSLLLCACSSAPEEPKETEKIIENTVTVEPADEDASKLRITEFMPKNHCTLLDAESDFSDWLELTNCSEAALDIEGWALSDGSGEPWALPAMVLERGERILVYASGKDRRDNELHTDFKLSEEDYLCLFTPAGNEVQRLSCVGVEADVAVETDAAEPVHTLYPSPGYENGSSGYESWQDSLAAKGPLVISEVMVANIFRTYEDYVGDNDWLIVKNISDESVQLSEYWLSDDDDQYSLWQFPDKSLGPGKSFMVLCSQTGYGAFPKTGFELNSTKEQLYLTKDNEIVDYLLLRDIPQNGSYGRMDNENGCFFFAETSILGENKGGKRRISKEPVSRTADGVFNDVDSVKVELEADGTIYYTLDGSLPSIKSSVYTEPVVISETGVLRAVSVEEGALPSRALTLSFILNENHSLPVASLNVDNPYAFGSIYRNGYKGTELPASFSLYEGENSFTIGCGVNMAGQTSLFTQPKKSMKLTFRGVYGEDTLEYDVFGEELKSFYSLTLRSGHVYDKDIFRQEIWQDLCMEMTDSVLSQYSKFAILYINGEYYGITCIKENISKGCYAQHFNVSKESVESAKTPDMEVDDFKSGIYRYCLKNDLSIQENYEHIESQLDIDSFIDWIIIEGVCANQDLFRNSRFFRSSEGSGKWQASLFDLDLSMLTDYSGDFVLGVSMPPEDFPFSGVLGDAIYRSRAIHPIVAALFENDEFKDRFLTRYAEVYDTVLSNERVLERIDYYERLLAPEVERNHIRWGDKPEEWQKWVEHLRAVITELDWQNYAKNSLCNYLELSEEEIAHYFG